MTRLHGEFSGWILEVGCPLTPQPIRLLLARDHRSGYSETAIGWSDLQSLTRVGDQIECHGSAGAVEGKYRLTVAGDAIQGTFSMEQPFAGTFPVSGHVSAPQQIITTVAEAVDSRAPYLPVVREVASLPGYTVYRPNDDAQHPVVIWGNGGGSLSNEGALTFLTQLAAAGFVVIAPGDPSARAVAVMNDASTNVLRSAIDWAADNSEAFADGSSIAVMGHSMGGVQSWAAAAHPAVKSLACWNGSSGPGSHLPQVVQAVGIPTMIVTGGPTDGAHSSSMKDFGAIASGVPAVLIENRISGHGGLFHGTNDREAVRAGAAPGNQELEVIASVLAIRWLNLTLRGDTGSARYFLGDAPVIDGLHGWNVWQHRDFGALVQGVADQTAHESSSTRS